MDPDISRWLLEFFLRQPFIEDHIINSLVSVLPLERANSSLKLDFLLRKIDSEVSNGVLSEEMLDCLELIEELEYRDGIETLESMKQAYCAVAVHCSVMVLVEGGVDKAGKYFDVVKRIWRGRVLGMEKCDMGVGLVSEELKEWRDMIEAGVWDSGVCDDVLVKSRGYDALEDVRRYILEARERRGPPFLEVLTETVKGDNTVGEVVGSGNDRVIVGESASSVPIIDRDCDASNLPNAGNDVISDESHDQCREGAINVSNAGNDVVTNKGDKEVHKGHVSHRRKHVAVGRRRIPVSITSRGVKIVDTEELACASDDRCVTTPETNKVQESLRASCLELKAVVKDPLPDALRLAETLRSDLVIENVDEHVIDNRSRLDGVAPSSSADKSADALQANQGNPGNDIREKDNRPKPSLMERNNTAHVVEWDSVSCSDETSPRRPHLPSPEQRVISPLKKYESVKFAKRRKPKKWSILEEDTLRAGVQKYGTGQWKLILSEYHDIFEERTMCDLKDKWRNLMRS